MRIVREGPLKIPEPVGKKTPATCVVCMCAVVSDGTRYYDPQEGPNDTVTFVEHPHKPGESFVRELRAEAHVHSYEAKVNRRHKFTVYS